jgi:uncharacterized protein (DUF433 family)
MISYQFPLALARELLSFPPYFFFRDFSPNVAGRHGKPTIRGTRYLVSAILEYLAGGDSVEGILGEFPDLVREDILACIAYASASMKFKFVSPNQTPTVF